MGIRASGYGDAISWTSKNIELKQIDRRSATVVVVVYGFRGKETGGRPGECARINQLEKGRRETSRDRAWSRTFALRRKRSENGIGQR
jgi:hypothetical protein